MKPWKHLIEAEDRLRRLEKAYTGSAHPTAAQREAYVRELRRVGKGAEADVIDNAEGLRLMQAAYPRASDEDMTRLAEHYDLDVIRQMIASNTPNRINILGVADMNEVYHRTYTMADGSPRRYRINGQLRTLRRASNIEWFEIPVMYGEFNRYVHSVHLNQDNADQFMIDPDGP